MTAQAASDETVELYVCSKFALSSVVEHLALLSGTFDAAVQGTAEDRRQLQLMHTQFLDDALHHHDECIAKANQNFVTLSKYQDQLDAISRLVALHREPLKAKMAEQVGLPAGRLRPGSQLSMWLGFGGASRQRSHKACVVTLQTGLGFTANQPAHLHPAQQCH